jgi:hypothetical protein
LTSGPLLGLAEVAGGPSPALIASADTLLASSFTASLRPRSRDPLTLIPAAARVRAHPRPPFAARTRRPNYLRRGEGELRVTADRASPWPLRHFPANLARFMAAPIRAHRAHPNLATLIRTAHSSRRVHGRGEPGRPVDTRGVPYIHRGGDVAVGRRDRRRLHEHQGSSAARKAAVNDPPPAPRSAIPSSRVRKRAFSSRATARNTRGLHPQPVPGVRRRPTRRNQSRA